MRSNDQMRLWFVFCLAEWDSGELNEARLCKHSSYGFPCECLLMCGGIFWAEAMDCVILMPNFDPSVDLPPQLNQLLLDFWAFVDKQFHTEDAVSFNQEHALFISDF